jgi:CRP-like cAMP-binding protein
MNDRVQSPTSLGAPALLILRHATLYGLWVQTVPGHRARTSLCARSHAHHGPAECHRAGGELFAGLLPGARYRTAFELPMTRADIGHFLGLTIETVSRTFK